MKTNTKTLIYACNDKYFDGLFMSISSVLRHTKSSFNIYCLSADYSEVNPTYKVVSTKHSQLINKFIKTYNKNNTFKVLDCTKVAKASLFNKKNLFSHYSPYTALRLLLTKLNLKEDKALYLDVDVMANKDISHIWNINIDNVEICVCHNYWYRKLQKKDNFNAGVIFFNLKKMKETKYLDKAINIFNKKKMKWPDQMALCKTKTSFIFFPGNEYNYNHQKNDINDDVVLKHFCAFVKHFTKEPTNIKQWEIDNVHKYLNINNFDEDYLELQKWKSKL